MTIFSALDYSLKRFFQVPLGDKFFEIFVGIACHSYGKLPFKYFIFNHFLNLACCGSSESLPSDEDKSLEVEVSSRLLLLPYFFFFTGCNVTSGKTSLEELPSVVDSLFLRLFLLFKGSFEIRFEEGSCLFLWLKISSPLLLSLQD